MNSVLHSRRRRFLWAAAIAMIAVSVAVVHTTAAYAQLQPVPAIVGPQLGLQQEPILREEVDALRRRVEELEASGQAQFVAPAETSESVQATRRYPTLTVGGFLQTDTAWFIQDEASRAAVGDLADTIAIRRARVHFTGDLRPDAGYMIDLDFAASGHPSFRDMSLNLRNVPLVQNVRCGYFSQPFQMDAITSSRHLTFVERALPSAFALFQQTGVAVRQLSANQDLTWTVSGYRFETNNFGTISGDSGYGVLTRVTWLPWDDPESQALLHLGGAYSFGTPAAGTVRYQIQPGFFVIENLGDPTEVPPFVNTGDIPARNFNLFDAELAGAFGPLHFQAEAALATVQQIGGPYLSFPGGYAQVGWLLTGESRQYDRAQGVFGGVTPRENFRFGGGAGAWEIAGRWSFIDLDNQNVRGGMLHDLEAALNWYLTPHLKAQFVYVRGMLRSPGTDARSSASIIGGRVQFEF